MTITACGCSARRNSPNVCFANTTTRTTLNPPPVDPPMAPMNMRPSSTTCPNTGQAPKSAVVKPVVLMMAVTLKNAARRSPPNVDPRSRDRISATRHNRDAASVTPAYTRHSTSRNHARPRPVIMR